MSIIFLVIFNKSTLVEFCKRSRDPTITYAIRETAIFQKMYFFGNRIIPQHVDQVLAACVAGAFDNRREAGIGGLYFFPMFL
jgi:hypothetical protein